MRTIISYAIRKIAEFLKFADRLDADEISAYLEELIDISKSEGNFQENGPPLSLSDKGLAEAKSKLKNLPFEKMKGQTLTRIFIRLLEALEVSSKFHENLEPLFKYLKRTLPYPWPQIEKELGDMGPDMARKKLGDMLQKSLTGMSAVVKLSA